MIVDKAGDGGGLVVSSPAGIKNGVTFTGWTGGGCAGSGLACTVSLQAATTVSATFKQRKGE